MYELLQSEELLFDDAFHPGFNKAHKRKLTGMFYTPDWVVKYCFNQFLENSPTGTINSITESLETDADFKILDPACGSGNFLLGAVAWFKSKGLNQKHLLELCRNSLYGQDVDGRAVSICRLGIILALAAEFQKLIRQQGSTATAGVLEDLLSNLQQHINTTDSVLQSAVVPVSSKRQFDLVIANPPYVSYGSRNQPKLSDSWSRFLKTGYPDTSEYKIRLHSVFQDIALRHARPDGLAVLLVPDAFLTGQYYSRLRAKLLQSLQIQSLTELPDDTITQATVGRWCVATYKKTQPDPRATVKLFAFNQCQAQSDNPKPDKKFQMPVNVLVTNDRQRIRLLFNRIDCDIWQQLDQLPPLSSQLKGHTGIRGINGKSTITAQQCRGANWKRGLIKGNSVTAHLISWDGSWIKIQPDLLYAGGFDPDIVDNPKLLVRQTGDAIIAALDTTGLYHLNNLHSFSAQKVKGNSIGDLRYFDGLLNSHLWLYLYRTKSREHGKALAQIDIELVESLPLPQASEQMSKLIISLVSASRHIQLKLSKTGKAQNREQLANRLSFIERALDSLVYQLYALSGPQVRHLESEYRPKRQQPLPDMEEIICFTQNTDNMMT